MKDFEEELRKVDMFFSILVDYLELHQEEEFVFTAALELAYIIKDKLKNIILLEDR